jgi:transcription elongation GreA/GreB family factor
MREQLEKLVKSGKLQKQNLEGLLDLVGCGYCMHSSWGVGKIISIDTVYGKITIDFKDVRNREFELNFAVERLKPMPKDHILVQKFANPENLKMMAATDHVGLVKMVLKSFGNIATVDKIKSVLVPDIIPDDWKKWWEVAKAEIRKDGHIILPRHINEPLIYTEETKTVEDRLMEDFYNAKGLKARIAIVAEIIRNLEEFKDKQGKALEIVQKLNSEISSYQRTQPGVAIEAIFIRDDLLKAVGLEPEEGYITAMDIWAQEASLATMLEKVPTIKHRRLLETFKKANPDRWKQILFETINNIPSRLVPELANILLEKENIDEFKEYLEKLISQHTASSDLLYWVVSELNDPKVKKTNIFSNIVGHELFRAALSAIERDNLNERKTTRLADFLVDEPGFAVSLLEDASDEVVKDIVRTIKTLNGLNDMDRRSLLGQIAKRFPYVKPLLAHDSEKRESFLMVSWESLEKKKKELDEILKVKIPQNSKDIEIARSYGDLSENHEFKAAKEMQKLLFQQKAELEKMIAMARGTDFSDANTDEVSIGTKVELLDMETNQRITYSILGAWDYDEEKHIISYLSPLAKTIMHKKVGDVVEFGDAAYKRIYRIESISAAIEKVGNGNGQVATQTTESQVESKPVVVGGASDGIKVNEVIHDNTTGAQAGIEKSDTTQVVETDQSGETSGDNAATVEGSVVETASTSPTAAGEDVKAQADTHNADAQGAQVVENQKTA